MKKLTIVLIVVSLLFCSLALVGCKDGDDGETFVGAISKTTYESKEDAAKGFLEEEISGDAFTAEYVSYTKTSELSQKEIDKLELADEYKSGIESVEKGEVEYSEQLNKQEEKVAKLASETCKRTVYIVIYTTKEYRFFSPAIIEGGTLTTSYFDYLFDMNRYLNCTVETDMSDEKMLMKITDKVISMHLSNIFEEDEGASYYYYCEPYLYLCVYDENNVVEVNRLGKLSLKDALNGDFKDADPEYLAPIGLTLGMLGGMDHSYFVKTKTGYELKEEIKQFPDEYYSVNVSNDRIVKVESSLYVNDAGNWDRWEWSFTFSDFDSTTVEIPKEIVEAVEKYIENN